VRWLVAIIAAATLLLHAAVAIGAQRKPLVQTGTADAITTSGATLHGTVNTRGRSAMYRFDYGLTTSYTAHTPWTPVQSTTYVAVQAAVSQLAAASAYHYRVTATTCSGCGLGTSFGVDATFDTAGSYQNPVYSAAPAPDPYVLDNAGTQSDYWEFNTGGLFPVLHSTDLLHWTSMGTAMTVRPSWVVPTGDWHPWAPSVVQKTGPCPGGSSDSCYVMYHVGISAQFGFNCVAVATSPDPGGPYIDTGPLSNGTVDGANRPVGCGDKTGYGNIDPSPFTDPADGRTYLYVSTDHTCPSGATACTSANGKFNPTISVIPLAADGLSATGPRTALFSGALGTWEATGLATAIVENPSGLAHSDASGNHYYLLYSGGNWQGAYGMGYARADRPDGPFVKSPANPILSETSAVRSPGGGDTPVIGPHGAAWLVYHGRVNSTANPRTLRIDSFSWTPGQSGTPDVPTISGPTSTPQPTAP
jgi:beta-xylosidase